MSDAEEVATGLFALVVSGFVVLIVFRSLSGSDIQGLTQLFTSFFPVFVVFLVFLILIFRVFEEL